MDAFPVHGPPGGHENRHLMDEFNYLPELGEVEDYGIFPDIDDEFDEFDHQRYLPEHHATPEKGHPEVVAQSNPMAKDACFQMVLSIFPDIRLDYLDEVAAARAFDPEDSINHILGEEEKGNKYPRKQRHANRLKRKRSSTDDFEHILQKREVLTADEMAAIQKRFETLASEPTSRPAKYRNKA